MSELKASSQVYSFCSILYKESIWGNKEEALIEMVGSLGISNDLLFFHDNDSMHSYYEKEMGAGLKRFFVFDTHLKGREALISQKIKADQLERDHFQEGQRQARSFNFDPGYISMEQMVLATGKPYSHRLYLGEGVYGELTYAWESGCWVPFKWAYPDYKDPRACEVFEQVRCMLANQLCA